LRSTKPFPWRGGLSTRDKQPTPFPSSSAQRIPLVLRKEDTASITSWCDEAVSFQRPPKKAAGGSKNPRGNEGEASPNANESGYDADYSGNEGMHVPRMHSGKHDQNIPFAWGRDNVSVASHKEIRPCNHTFPSRVSVKPARRI